MKKPLIITGTDTDIGKTYCTLKIINLLKQEGLQVASMKPVATGCTISSAGLRNHDALQLQSAANIQLPYEWVNPYAFEPPIAPHIAANIVCQEIDIEHIYVNYLKVAQQADIVVIEGIGGWCVPFNPLDSLKDLALYLGGQVILVVGLRLGCINHALLTAERIQQDGLPLIGWIANHIDPQFTAQTTVLSLRERINAPLLASIPYQAHAQPAEAIMFSELLMKTIHSVAL